MNCITSYDLLFHSTKKECLFSERSMGDNSRKNSNSVSKAFTSQVCVWKCWSKKKYHWLNSEWVICLGSDKAGCGCILQENIFTQEWYKESYDSFQKYSNQSYFRSELSGCILKFQNWTEEYHLVKNRLRKTPSDV